jgi:hypothetical protein
LERPPAYLSVAEDKGEQEARDLADLFFGHSMRAGYATTVGEHDMARLSHPKAHAASERGYDRRLHPRRPGVDEERLERVWVLKDTAMAAIRTALCRWLDAHGHRIEVGGVVNCCTEEAGMVT